MTGKQKKVFLSDMLKVRPVHFNDSKNPCGSHKDRHEKLGQGQIGMEAMRRIAPHPALSGHPFILETPTMTRDTSGDSYCSALARVRFPFESGELSENSACANLAQADNGKNPIKGGVAAAIAKAFGIMCANKRCP